MRVAFVGGGKASLTLINYFKSIDYIKIVGLSDINENAAGVVRAKELGIPTYKDMAAMLKIDIDTIIEVTGNQTVKKIVLDSLKPNQHFMSSNAAKIMCDSIDMQNHQKKEIIEKLNTEFEGLTTRLNSSAELINNSIRNIESVLMSMQIVTMNARIEAARAGEVGKAFEVVVQAMQGTLTDIEKTLKNITEASSESKRTIAELANTEAKLKDALLG